jgi:hypothetical protein
MLESEKLAIAAHLHVLLRRKTGRVTDTEWMAANAQYAGEVVRFARASAREDGHTDLAEWADKLETALNLKAHARPGAGTAPTGATGASPTSLPEDAAKEEAQRYVRGIR